MIQVSIILPVYNAEKHIEQTMDALIQQTCTSYEVIAVNDGSQDSSGLILDDYAERFPHIVRVIHIDNGGVWNARKVGLANATGLYIGFCDSDDLPVPKMYEQLLNKAVTSKAEMTICPFWRVDMETDEILSVEMIRFGEAVYTTSDDAGFLTVINTALWNKLFLASVIKQSVDLTSPPRILEDMMLQCSIYPLCKTVAFLKEPLYKYRVRKGSAMSSIHANEFSNIQDTMTETRSYIQKLTKEISFLYVCDAMAFIHIALSVYSLQLKSKIVSSQLAIKRTRECLNRFFPLHKKNPYLSVRYCVTHNHSTLKPTLAYYAYRMHLLAPAIKAYNYAISKNIFNTKW